MSANSFASESSQGGRWAQHFGYSRKDNLDQFILAAKSGKDKEVENLAKNVDDVNAVGTKGYCALWAAAKDGYPSTVSLLVHQLHANVETTDEEYGRTSLAVAAFNNHAHVVDVLIKAGASTSTPDRLQRTPVSSAVSANACHALRVLVEAGADTQRPNSFGHTPLDIAKDKRRREAFDILTRTSRAAEERTADGSAYTTAEWPSSAQATVRRAHSPPRPPVSRSISNFVDRLDLEYADRRDFIQTLVSPEWGFTDPERELRALKPEEYADLCEALPHHRRERFREIVRELSGQATRSRGEVEGRGDDPDQGASEMEVPENLVSLINAARYGDVAEVQRWIDEEGVDPNLTGWHGRTALWLASYKGQMETVRFLLDRGVDVDKPDETGLTPLLGACINDQAETVRLLHAYGANPHRINNRGESAFSLASKRGHVDTMRVLEELRG